MTSTSERSAASTIYTQSASIIISLLVGFGLIYLFSRLGNRLEIRWPDGEIHDFLEIWLYGGIAIVATLWWTVTHQFEEGLEPFDTFKQAIYFSLGCWVLFIVIMQGCILTLLSNPVFAVAIIGFNLLAFTTLGLSIGSIQGLTVKLSRFDKQHHLNQISTIADLAACKNNKLPYRQKIYIFWDIVAYLTISFILLILILFLYQNGENNPLPYIFGGFLVMFFLFTALFFLKTALLPKIHSTTETTTKSIRMIRLRYVKAPHYFLHHNNQTFQTDSKIWYDINPGKTYTIWYLEPFFSNSKHQGKVIAYELIKSQPQQSKELNHPLKRNPSIGLAAVSGIVITTVVIISRFFKTEKHRH